MEILDKGEEEMTILRFLFTFLATVAVLPASVLYEFQGTTTNGLTELFTYQQAGPIITSESVPVSALTYCNECAPLGYVDFGTDAYEGDDVVVFPDQNGTSYDYYFVDGALTYNGSYETIVPSNIGTLDVSGAPPIPEPNECPALLTAFLFSIGIRWYRLKLRS